MQETEPNAATQTAGSVRERRALAVGLLMAGTLPMMGVAPEDRVIVRNSHQIPRQNTSNTATLLGENKFGNFHHSEQQVSQQTQFPRNTGHKRHTRKAR